MPNYQATYVPMTTDTAVVHSQVLLKYAYGITLVLIGLDKLLQTNFIVLWTSYVSPLAQSVLPFTPEMIVIGLGFAEVVVGVALLTRWTRIAAYIVIAVLAVIIVNLLNLGLYDIAARDLLIALGALALAWLTKARERSYI